MFSRKNKEPERYYLLPGMGGRSWRQKQKVILKWTLFAGMLVSVLFALILYFMNVRW